MYFQCISVSQCNDLLSRCLSKVIVVLNELSITDVRLPASASGHTLFGCGAPNMSIQTAQKISPQVLGSQGHGPRGAPNASVAAPRVDAVRFEFSDDELSKFDQSSS